MDVNEWISVECSDEGRCTSNIRTHLLVHIIVFRDMVWKLSKLQSGYKELCVYVEPYLTPCTSFVLGLLIFK